MKTTIKHPIIASYVNDFIYNFEISDHDAEDKHNIFEKYMNHLVLSLYENDQNAHYDDMEVGTAFGIDGLAIYISDRIVTSKEDVDHVLDELKKIDVTFVFTQVKTENKFDRQHISDFFSSIRRFFNFDKNEIPELTDKWEITKYIYSKSSKFKNNPEIKMFYTCLSATPIDCNDSHLKSTIEMALNDLNDLTIFKKIERPIFLGIRDVMILHEKLTSEREVTINMSKQPVPYPKDTMGKINNAYYGLIKLDEFIKILVDEIDGVKTLKNGIFDDNIRHYLGSSEKIEVNKSMKDQLIGRDSYLFGLLNNGITIICDKISINSEEVHLQNYQIVNGCQTSNVIFECINNINTDTSSIFMPIRLISTEDDDAKSAIIKATNSQNELKAEQLIALKSIQKAIEQYYRTKQNTIQLYYERRTEQYRDERIQKTKIINIPTQIKATSALIYDLPHAVSGQYGKVERETRGLLFKDTDFAFLNTYFVSGLIWYKVDRFVQNNEIGKKYKRARWHIIMLAKYCVYDKKITDIDKNSEKLSNILEKILLNDKYCDLLLQYTLDLIKKCLSETDDKFLDDRKIFERKETTERLIKYVQSQSHEELIRLHEQF